MDRRSAISSPNTIPGGNRVGWLMMASILVEAWDLYSIAFVLVFISEQYHPDRCCSACRRGHAGRRADRRDPRRLAVRQDRPARDVPVHHDPVHRAGPGAGLRDQRRLVGGRPLDARHSAGQRHLHRLHLHHGVHAQGQARGHGQPLAVHVRGRRGADAGGHRGVPGRRHPARAGLAHDARPGGACRRCDHPVHASRPAGNGDLADPPGPLPRGQAGLAGKCTTTISTMLPDEDIDVPQAAPDRVPRRPAQGPDPLARHALRLDRLFRARAASSRPSPSIFRCCSSWSASRRCSAPTWSRWRSIASPRSRVGSARC